MQKLAPAHPSLHTGMHIFVCDKMFKPQVLDARNAGHILSQWGRDRTSVSRYRPMAAEGLICSRCPATKRMPLRRRAAASGHSWRWIA